MPTTKKQKDDHDLRVPSVSTLTKMLKTLQYGSPQEHDFDNVYVYLRHSIAQRREDQRKLDFDIVKIKTSPTRKGIGTKFIVNLVKAAGLLGRGVFLEQTISTHSENWAKKLVKDGIMKPYIVERNFLSTEPVVPT